MVERIKNFQSHLLSRVRFVDHSEQFQAKIRPGIQLLKHAAVLPSSSFPSLAKTIQGSLSEVKTAYSQIIEPHNLFDGIGLFSFNAELISERSGAAKWIDMSFTGQSDLLIKEDLMTYVCGGEVKIWLKFPGEAQPNAYFSVFGVLLHPGFQVKAGLGAGWRMEGLSISRMCVGLDGPDGGMYHRSGLLINCLSARLTEMNLLSGLNPGQTNYLRDLQTQIFAYTH